MPNFAQLRPIIPYQEHHLAGLSRETLDPNPFRQFAEWLKLALEAKLLQPNAMTLATATREGRVSARVVLLKDFDEQGFVFYTNTTSHKARDLAENAQAALVFYWPELDRQVRIEGQVSEVSRAEAEVYFHSRPLGSQLGAWASAQSQPLPNRAVLEEKLAQLEAEYAGREVPLPPHWGGYCVRPELIEFWQGRPNRLHDRFVYTPTAEGQWAIERLSP